MQTSIYAGNNDIDFALWLMYKLLLTNRYIYSTIIQNNTIYVI